MLKSHLKFHSTNGKRRVLVVDDEMINREILGAMLQEQYEVLFACDGEEALTVIRENRETLSLVLLDILMPKRNGLEVLQALREDPELAQIPVIVITSEAEAEVKSLQLGAMDYLPKPYPAADVVLARAQRTIELFEDRDIIQSTERDSLTGLYNREYFYRYAEQYDQFHRETAMDAIFLDVNHFHTINERYGKAYGDEVLRRIGQTLREFVKDGDGIVCRRLADTFMIYCPHREDHLRILEGAAAGLSGESAPNNRIRLRMGVYPNVDKKLDVERRFDRAKLAADSIRDSATQSLAFYDSALHDREIYTEQLIEEFPTAIREKQFCVFYQPKFDVRPETPLLSSAEALVRWKHPQLGMISPGVFIPLFEKNGLIQQLDTYVWREAARQMREWKERFGFSVPVSVNVSRIDLYDPHLFSTLQEILRDNGLRSEELILEVTESAYTRDAEQIIETISKLREQGFRIEMDDFGTGYSSLNMISRLPIDALKLDMQFIRDAFREGGNTHMLEVVIEIADYLSVPVVAEGVETEEQMDALRILGCDIVQGYFFSRPVPAQEFEAFILQRKEAEKTGAGEAAVLRPSREISQYIPEEADEQEQQPAPIEEKGHGGMQLGTASVFLVLLALLAAVALFAADLFVARGYQRMEQASDRYITAQMAASDMESGSDYLTDRVRCFVVTGELEYLNDFFEEVEVTRTRDRAVERLETLLGGDSSALSSLNTALALSNELIGTEYLAMRMTLATGNYDMSRIPEEIANIELSPADLALSRAELREKAELLVFDSNYMHHKDRIRDSVRQCTQELIRSSSQELERASGRMSLLVNIQATMTVLFLVIVLGIVLLINTQIRRPLERMVERMRSQEEIQPQGVEELRFVTRTYNSILRENAEARERLSHEASHDALTGLFNRGAYDLLMGSVDTAHMALILVDVDNFKGVNDTYGHAVGDRVLKRVAEILLHSFRSVDIICRLGGDEFVVIMTRVNGSMAQLVRNKVERMNDLLGHPKDDLPPVSLSVGVAFSDRENPQGDIFTDADTALYRVKESGRRGCEIY